MAKFWKMVNQVIDETDIILLVVDARAVAESINREIMDKVERKEKKIIIVINKCDLISKEEYKKLQYGYGHGLFISAIEHLSTTKLLKRIMEVGKGKEVTVGVVGYPNTGKSSVINALKGKKSAPTSSVSGYTKGLQKIRISKKMVLIDTPGVIPYKEYDDPKHALIAAKDANKIKDPEEAVYGIMKRHPGLIERFHEVLVSEDFDETLEAIAVKRRVLKKGGIPDTKTMARQILFAWQKGKIKEPGL